MCCLTTVLCLSYHLPMLNGSIATWFGAALASASLPHILGADQVTPILQLVLAIIGTILGWLASKKKPE